MAAIYGAQSTELVWILDFKQILLLLLIKQFNISCPEVNNAASSTGKSYMVS